MYAHVARRRRNSDVIMGAIASEITGILTVGLAFYFIQA